MNDRYLFKAKDNLHKEWHIGNLVKEPGGMYIRETDKDLMVCIDTSTICQCTGLKDKNGNLIWESDVINTKFGKVVVIWDKAEWRIKWIKDTIWRKDLHFWTNEYDWKCEVVGNVFSNPELLESEVEK